MHAAVSNERLMAALRTAAELVAVHGDEFTATFETLETELQKRQNTTSTKARAAALLSGFETQIETQSETHFKELQKT